MAQQILLGTGFVGVDRTKINDMFTELYGSKNTQTGTSYTLVIGDFRKTVEMNNAAANTLTVPPNSSVAFPIDTIIEVYQMGAGQTTVAAGSGVTLRQAGALRTQYSTASLRKRATDEWVLAGDLA